MRGLTCRCRAPCFQCIWLCPAGHSDSGRSSHMPLFHTRWSRPTGCKACTSGKNTPKNTVIFFTYYFVYWSQTNPHHPFSSLDFLYDRLHVKVSKLSPRRRRQLHRPRGEKLETGWRSHARTLTPPARLRRRALPTAAVLPCTCSARPPSWSYRCEARPWFRSLPRRRDKSRSAGRRPRG